MKYEKTVEMEIRESKNDDGEVIGKMINITINKSSVVNIWSFRNEPAKITIHGRDNIGEIALFGVIDTIEKSMCTKDDGTIFHFNDIHMERNES